MITNTFEFTFDDNEIESAFQENKITIYEYICDGGDFDPQDDYNGSCRAFGKNIDDEPYITYMLDSYKKALCERDKINQQNNCKNIYAVDRKSKIISTPVWFCSFYPDTNRNDEKNLTLDQFITYSVLGKKNKTYTLFIKNHEGKLGLLDGCQFLNIYKLTFINKEMRKKLDDAINKYVEEHKEEIAFSWIQTHGHLFDSIERYYKLLDVIKKDLGL